MRMSDCWSWQALMQISPLKKNKKQPYCWRLLKRFARALSSLQHLLFIFFKESVISRATAAALAIRPITLFLYLPKKSCCLPLIVTAKALQARVVSRVCVSTRMACLCSCALLGSESGLVSLVRQYQKTCANTMSWSQSSSTSSRTKL